MPVNALVTDPAAVAPAARDWAELTAALRGCVACGELAAERTQVVPGQFPPGAQILLLGEAPGATEDARGLPFVGRSGALLDAVLAEAGVGRENVAVLNVLKCRPPGNRAPKREEAANCRPWLDRQIALIDPVLIVTLGLTAAVWALGKGISLTGVRGRAHPFGDRHVLATYHPSAALRFGPSGKPRAAMVEDLRLAADLVPTLGAGRQAGPAQARSAAGEESAAWQEPKLW